MFAYVVRCSFTSLSSRDAFVIWLRDRHINDVLASGALDAEMIVLDDSHAVEIRYHFESREAFARYEREHAADRRREGLEEIARLAIPEGGVMFTRSTGEVACFASLDAR